MKKIILTLLIGFFSLIGFSQETNYRTDAAVLNNKSEIASYQGGSKIIFLRDTTQGIYYLYFGIEAVNGTTIIAGANGSRWKKLYADPVDIIPIDVFLIAGQSNAQGYGNSSQSPTVPSGKVLQYNHATGLTNANDPVGNANTGSMWPAFGIEYNATTGRYVCFVPAGVAGSSQASAANTGLGTWDTTGTLFDTSVARLNAALNYLSSNRYKPNFKGVIWFQGETDALGINNSLINQATYIAAFQKMIGRYRGLYGKTMPFYIIKIGTPQTGSDAGFAQIRAAQEQIINGDSLTNIVFRGAYDYFARGLMQTTYHFTQPAYNEMGRIVADNIISTNYNGFQSLLGNIYLPVGKVGINMYNPDYPLTIADSIRVGNLSISKRGISNTPSINSTSFITFKTTNNLLINQGTGSGIPEFRLTGEGSSTTLQWSGIINGFNFNAASASQGLLITTSGLSTQVNLRAGNIILRPGTDAGNAIYNQYTNDSVLVELNPSGTGIFYVKGGNARFAKKVFIELGNVDSTANVGGWYLYQDSITGQVKRALPPTAVGGGGGPVTLTAKRIGYGNGSNVLNSTGSALFEFDDATNILKTTRIDITPTSGYIHKFLEPQADTAVTSPAAHYYVYRDNSFVNADGQRDVVMFHISYNSLGSGTRVKSNEASFHLATESHYQNNGNDNFELYWGFTNKAGTITYRPWGMDINKVTGVNSTYWRTNDYQIFTPTDTIPYWAVNSTRAQFTQFNDAANFRIVRRNTNRYGTFYIDSTSNLFQIATDQPGGINITANALNVPNTFTVTNSFGQPVALNRTVFYHPSNQVEIRYAPSGALNRAGIKWNSDYGAEGMNGGNLFGHNGTQEGYEKLIDKRGITDVVRELVYTTGGVSTLTFSQTATGNVGLGVSGVSDRFVVKGLGATSATYAMTIMNSSSSNLLRVRNDGQISFPQLGSGIAISTSGVISAGTTSSSISSNISDETGSGALVFGTSPEFTTKITSPIVDFVSGGGANAYLISFANSALNFAAGNGVPKMTINSSGNVGIGVSLLSPSRKLYVDGSIGMNKDSATTVTSVGSDYFLIVDNSTGQFKKINKTNIDEFIYASLNTSANTIATISTYTPANNETGIIELSIVGAQGSGYTAHRKQISYHKTSGGTLTIDQDTDIGTLQSNDGSTITIDVSSGAIRFRVTPGSTNNTNWSLKYHINSVVPIS